MERRREGSLESGAGDVAGPVQEPLIQLHELPPSGRVTTFHTGPLPTPEDLARYGEVSPTLVDRIIGMAELDLRARTMALEVTSRSEAFAVKAGALAVVVIPCLVVVAAIVMALLGLSPMASAIVGISAPVLFGVARIVAAAKGRTPNDD